MSGAGISRRRLLVAGAGTLAGAGAVGGLVAGRGGAPPRTRAATPLPPEPAGLPARQHAWDATLAADRRGNRTVPRFHRLLLFSLAGRPGVEDARALEGTLRGIERRWPHGPAGVLMAVGWGPAWFEAIEERSPVPKPVPLSDTELPELEDHAMAVHLASDHEPALRAADALLTATGSPVRTALRLRSRRTGTNGRGLARRTARRLELPAGVEPPEGSPLLMGFQSGLRANQAREDDVTIASGPWAGSTTMHASVIALTLGSWYRSLDEADRRAQMFGPGVNAEAVARPGRGITPPGGPLAEVARRHGRVGHAQAAATARRDGRPRILRRDFNGVVDGQPVTHFVAYQADIDDFVATRRAMNADAAVGVNGVDQVVNNGINEWLSVHRRANFLVPPRSRRAFPALPGWDRT